MKELLQNNTHLDNIDRDIHTIEHEISTVECILIIALIVTILIVFICICILYLRHAEALDAQKTQDEKIHQLQTEIQQHEQQENKVVKVLQSELQPMQAEHERRVAEVEQRLFDRLRPVIAEHLKPVAEQLVTEFKNDALDHRVAARDMADVDESFRPGRIKSLAHANQRHRRSSVQLLDTNQQTKQRLFNEFRKHHGIPQNPNKKQCYGKFIKCKSYAHKDKIHEWKFDINCPKLSLEEISESENYDPYALTETPRSSQLALYLLECVRHSLAYSKSPEAEIIMKQDMKHDLSLSATERCDYVFYHLYELLKNSIDAMRIKSSEQDTSNQSARITGTFTLKIEHMKISPADIDTSINSQNRTPKDYVKISFIDSGTGHPVLANGPHKALRLVEVQEYCTECQNSKSSQSTLKCPHSEERLDSSVSYGYAKPGFQTSNTAIDITDSAAVQRTQYNRVMTRYSTINPPPSSPFSTQMQPRTQHHAVSTLGVVPEDVSIALSTALLKPSISDSRIIAACTSTAKSTRGTTGGKGQGTQQLFEFVKSIPDAGMRYELIRPSKSIEGTAVAIFIPKQQIIC